MNRRLGGRKEEIENDKAHDDHSPNRPQILRIPRNLLRGRNLWMGDGLHSRIRFITKDDLIGIKPEILGIG